MNTRADRPKVSHKPQLHLFVAVVIVAQLVSLVDGIRKRSIMGVDVKISEYDLHGKSSFILLAFPDSSSFMHK
jgi:hypothetical protein